MTTPNPILFSNIYDFDRNGTSDAILMRYDAAEGGLYETIVLTNAEGGVDVRTPAYGLELIRVIQRDSPTPDLEMVYLEGNLDDKWKRDAMRIERGPNQLGKGDWRAALYTCEGPPKDVMEPVNPDELCSDKAGVISSNTKLTTALGVPNARVIDFSGN